MEEETVILLFSRREQLHWASALWALAMGSRSRMFQVRWRVGEVQITVLVQCPPLLFLSSISIQQ